MAINDRIDYIIVPHVVLLIPTPTSSMGWQPWPLSIDNTHIKLYWVCMYWAVWLVASDQVYQYNNHVNLSLSWLLCLGVCSLVDHIVDAAFLSSWLGRGRLMNHYSYVDYLLMVMFMLLLNWIYLSVFRKTNQSKRCIVARPTHLT